METAFDIIHASKKEYSIEKGLSIAKSNIIGFEDVLGLPFQTDITFNMDDFYSNSNKLKSEEVFAKIKDLADKIFHKVMEITQEEGLFIVLNSDFEKDTLRIMKKSDFKDFLIDSESINYASSIFSNESYDLMEFSSRNEFYVQLFLEIVWIFLESANVCARINDHEKTYNLFLKELLRWKAYMEMNIDRSKYLISVDMVDVYQKGYDFIYSLTDAISD